MVRLAPGQKLMTEMNGKWVVGRVKDVDASLVQMQFQTDTTGQYQCDWIYRGSTRLKPLYDQIVKEYKACPPSYRLSNPYSFSFNKQNQKQTGAMVSRRRTGAVRRNVLEYLPVGA